MSPEPHQIPRRSSPALRRGCNLLWVPRVAEWFVAVELWVGVYHVAWRAFGENMAVVVLSFVGRRGFQQFLN
jgi:hypothetical protein